MASQNIEMEIAATSSSSAVPSPSVSVPGPSSGSPSDSVPATPTDTAAAPEKSFISRRLLGIFFTLTAAFIYSLSALVVKVIRYPPFKLGVWRFFFMIIITLPFLFHGEASRRRAGKEGIFQQMWPLRKLTALIILQAGLSANFILSSFFGLNYLEIGDSIVISTSAPVFVTLLAFFILKEKCGYLSVLLGALTLVGVATICKPPLLTGAAAFNDQTIWGVIFSFGSMCILTFCYVVLRYLRKVHHALLQITFAVWGLVESGIIAFFYGVLTLPGTWTEFALLCLSAALAFTAQTCLTLALKYEEAGVVAMVRTIEVIFCYLWQTLFFHHRPDLYSMIGASILVTCVLMAAFRNIIATLPENHAVRKRFRVVLF